MFLNKTSNMLYGNVYQCYFGTEKLFFEIIREEAILENITFCLCYKFSLQFCYSQVFSLERKTIDISYFLARHLRDGTIWYCCHNLISRRNNIFDINLIWNMLYRNISQSYFGVKKARMFLTFLESKWLLELSHFAYVIGTKEVSFWKYLKPKIDDYNLITFLVRNIEIFDECERSISVKLLLSPYGIFTTRENY